MKKEEKDKIKKHVDAYNKIEEILNKYFLNIYENAKKELLEKYDFIKEEDFATKFEITLSPSGELKLNPLDNSIESSYKIINNESLIGDSKLLAEISQTTYSDIAMPLFNFIRELDPKGKFKKSETTINKFTNYHIEKNKIFYNDNWNFVSFTLQNDGLKINIYTGEYSPNRIVVYYEKPYPYFKITDSFQIEDAKKLIEESFFWKHKQINDI